MIANESKSDLPMSPSTDVKGRDSHLICLKCNTAFAADDSFCQECGATLIAAKLPVAKVEYSGSLKRFSVLLVVILCGALAVFAVLGIAGSYDGMSEDYICEHANKLLRDNDIIQGADILQRLYFARGLKLRHATLELLAQALVKRSDLYVGRNQIELAIKDLKELPPGTEQTEVAAKKLAALASPAVAPQNAIMSVPPTAAPHAAKLGALEPVPEKSKALPQSESTLDSQKQLKASAALPAKKAFLEEDVANYNRLLAAYFERIGQESEQSTDSSKAISEPPTLKEWVNSGRVDF